MPINKIEINFAIPVELTDAEMKVLDTIANDAARRTETAERVHWAAGCGSKPNWSKTDCAIFGYEPTADSPEAGEPTFNDDIFSIETATRERYQSEPFEPEKRRTPIADMLLAMRDPHKRSGVGLIREERVRQLTVEGWTPEHDDEHIYGELAQASQAYCHAAIHQSIHGSSDMNFLKFIPNPFPKNWDSKWWKPSTDPIRNLVKAGALIAAEIDRLRRKGRKERLDKVSE